MNRIVKYLGWANFFGLLATNVCLIVFVSLDSDAWGPFYISINLLVTIPFIISGIVSVRNAETTNDDIVKRTLYAVFFVLLILSIILPFYFELEGLLICISILSLGLLVKFKVHSSLGQLILLDTIGFGFLIVDAIVVYGFR